MSTIFRFEVRRFPATRVIGKQVAHSARPGAPNPLPALWEAMERDGTLSFLRGLPECSTPEPDAVGWMGEYDPETMGFTYLAGILTRPGTPVPEGYAHRDIPECLMGIGWIRGRDEGGDVYQGAHDHTARAMRESGYEYDGAAGGFEMEYYSHREFGVPLASGAKELVMGYYSPCRGADATDNDGATVLPGVPKIGFHIATCPFPGSLHACMSYLGEKVPLDFLMGVTGAAPEMADDLQSAAAPYDEVAGFVNKVWKWGGDSMGPEVREGLADRALRREIAAQVRLAKEREERAVELIEHAVNRIP